MLESPPSFMGSAFRARVDWETGSESGIHFLSFAIQVGERTAGTAGPLPRPHNIPIVTSSNRYEAIMILMKHILAGQSQILVLTVHYLNMVACQNGT